MILKSPTLGKKRNNRKGKKGHTARGSAEISVLRNNMDFRDSTCLSDFSNEQQTNRDFYSDMKLINPMYEAGMNKNKLYGQP